jgi:hypothetical protein
MFVERSVAGDSSEPPSVLQRVQQFLWDRDGEDVERCAAFNKNPDSLKYDLEEVDLKGDGANYVLALGPHCFCSPTGNCPFAAVAANGGNVTVILTARRVQQFVVLKTSSHGYLDLELIGHDSASASTHWIYRFDGAQYRLHSCSEWEYQALDKDGIVHELISPKIVVCASRD